MLFTTFDPMMEKTLRPRAWRSGLQVPFCALPAKIGDKNVYQFEFAVGAGKGGLRPA